MNTFWSYFDTFWGGFVLSPVAYYVFKRFGAVLWADIQALAVSLWNKVKAAF